MRVTFTQGELHEEFKTGMFKKGHRTYYTINTKVEYTEEEKAIIEKYELWDKVLGSHPVGANKVDEALRLMARKPESVETMLKTERVQEHVDVTIRGLQNHTYVAINPRVVAEHRKAMTAIVHQAKEYIMSMVQPVEGPDTFEL